MCLLGQLPPLSGPLNSVVRYFWAQLWLGLKLCLKAFAVQDGCQLLAAGVYDGGHVRVFVSVLPKVSIPGLMPEFKKQLWGGHLWLEGYAVRTAGDVTGAED